MSRIKIPAKKKTAVKSQKQSTKRAAEKRTITKRTERLVSELICPVCEEHPNERHLSHLRKAAKGLDERYAPFVFLEYVRWRRLRWACDLCLKKNASPGLWQKQNLQECHPEPVLAYTDINATCRTCKQSFLFSKEEQRYWYETLKFKSWSTPTSCAPCRSQLRYKQVREKKLGKLLPEFNSGRSDHLERIVTIYQELDKLEKAKSFLAGAAKTYSKNAAVAEQIRELRSQLRATR